MNDRGPRSIVRPGFIIMQIGNAELDKMCEAAIAPAMSDCGVDPKRVDKHNEGGLLKSEIVRFIGEADIIVADVTNERPNCYLEIGYAMGLDKFRNVVLTVREDHFPGSPNFNKGGPKVHFDLAGYGILSWSPNDLEKFRDDLTKLIKRRLAIIQPGSGADRTTWDQTWFEQQQAMAFEGLSSGGFEAAMEVRFALAPPKPEFLQTQLNDAVRRAEVRTFGWPIGVHIDSHEDTRPRARADGVFAELRPDRHDSYDYWAARRNGDFYTLMSLFEDEDQRESGVVYLNTRIARVTEALLFCGRFYSKLLVDSSATVHLAVRHTGLKNRVLSAAGNRARTIQKRTSAEDESEFEVTFTLSELASRIVGLVKDIVAPMLMLFDFFELDDSIYEQIVQDFIDGKVT